ncbi:MAG: SIR2 family protein [Candidatus Zixiibacteriota bacterium]
MKTEDSGKKLVCLFGSGISRKAGMPGTHEMSQELLSLREFHRTGVSVYRAGLLPKLGYFESPKEKANRLAITAIVAAVLELVRKELSERWATPPAPTYEDAYFLLDRLATAELGGLDDPLTVLGRRWLSRKVRTEVRSAGVDFSQLLHEATNCLSDLAWEMLDKPVGCTGYLEELVRALCNQVDRTELCIVTTNHDLVLERVFELLQIPYCDGFCQPDGSDVPLWRSGVFDTQADSVKLLKIHGSVDWFSLMPGEDWNFKRETARCLCGGLHRLPDGKYWRMRDFRPLILLGTYNKPDRYTAGMFAELFCRWRAALMNSRRLLISGFGFGDHAITRLIMNWAYTDRDRRMLVVSPSEPVAFPDSWNGELVENGILRMVKEKIEDVDWVEIASELDL